VTKKYPPAKQGGVALSRGREKTFAKVLLHPPQILLATAPFY